MRLTPIDLIPRIGSEIKADLETLLNGSAVAEFRRFLEERGIIALREVRATRVGLQLPGGQADNQR